MGMTTLLCCWEELVVVEAVLSIAIATTTMIFLNQRPAKLEDNSKKRRKIKWRCWYQKIATKTTTTKKKFLSRSRRERTKRIRTDLQQMTRMKTTTRIMVI